MAIVIEEGLALVFAVKKFHHYLYGHRFHMVTDHKPLLGLFGEDKGYPDRAAARILRWELLLSAYDYKLEYRPGASHCNADGLSRLPIDAKADDISRAEVHIHLMELINSPVSEEDVREETRKDPLLVEVLNRVRTGWREPDKKFKEGLKIFKVKRHELGTHGGCILWGNRLVIPKSLQEKVLVELHDVHPSMCHMKALGRGFVWWTGMDEDIESKARSCVKCAENQNNPARAPSHPWEFPAGPWERLHIDFVGRS